MREGEIEGKEESEESGKGERGEGGGGSIKVVGYAVTGAVFGFKIYFAHV